MKYTIQKLPPGWRWRETPGHGYLVVPNDANENVPSFLRNHHEYEEDCAWSIPVVFNKEMFVEEAYQQAMTTFRNWHPAEYEKAFNVVLAKGESHLKDDYYYRRLENMGKYEKRACFGDWCFDTPKGFTYAMLVEITEQDVNCTIGCATGKKVNVLLTQEQYKQGGPYNLENLIIYTRDETYYTWDDYKSKTGNDRYK
jgi:hypothetical protein